MSIDIKLAETEEEREEIFRFRYDVYVTEMQRNMPADHTKRMISDKFDDTALLWYVSKDNQIIASARGNLGKAGNLEFKEEYELETTFKEYCPERISTTSKFIIHKDFRSSTVPYRLVRSMYEFGLDQKILFDFCNANAGSHVVAFYKRVGYMQYKNDFDHPDFGKVTPLVLLLFDKDYLKKMRSPLSRLNMLNSKSQEEEYQSLNREKVFFY